MKILFLSISITGLALCSPATGLAGPDPATTPTNRLSFAQAWSLVQQHNPRLAASEQEVLAAGGTLLQADARPNPRLSLEAENFGGTREESGWDSAETTLMIAQPLETGGKRASRKAEARAAETSSRLSLQTRQLDLWSALVEAFTSALAAREKLALAGDETRLARERFAAVAARVKAGKAPPQEETRAAVEADLAEVNRETASNRVVSSQCRLAALWGQTQPDFATLEGRLDAIPAPPPLDGNGIPSATLPPDLALAANECARNEAALTSAQAQSRPDVELSAGIRRLEAGDNYACVAGVALPLPLFDRNRGGILKARHELARAQRLREAIRLDLAIEQATLVAEANAQQRELVILRDRALPAALQAMEAARTGYEGGKFAYLDWVDTERSLITLRGRWIETLATYHKTRALLARLSGNINSFILF